MDVYVDRTDLHRGEIVEVHAPELAPGQVRLAIDAFALTANNVTYAAIGDLLQYWSFFPAPGTWGRVPVWGYADAVESTVDDVPVGTRLYGYLPMSDELVIEPGRIGPEELFDLTLHRQAMAATYNRYVRVPAGGDRDPAAEARQMLLYPLFFTAFLIDDALADGDALPPTVIVSSASSKTAIGTAFQLRERDTAVVGLTSTANRGFVEGLGLYDRVVTYDELDQLGAGPAAFVDIAGNAEVKAAVHRHLGDDLVASLIVGDTHWDDATDGDDAPESLPGPAPAFFFAPTQITKRNDEWGREGLQRKVDEAWDRFTAWADGWLTIERRVGADAALATFQELVANRADPSVGFIVSMHEGS